MSQWTKRRGTHRCWRTVALRECAGIAVGLAVAAGITSSAHAQQADVYWANPANGLWSDAAKWSLGTSPNNGSPSGTTYRVFITATGSPYTVQLDTPVTIDDLTLDSTDATLSIEQSLTLSGSLLRNQGTLRLNGGSINGGIVNLNSGSLVVTSNSANRLSGTTVSGNISLATFAGALTTALTLDGGTIINGNISVTGQNQKIDVAGPLTLNGTATIGTFDRINFLQDTSLDSGTYVLNGGASNAAAAKMTSAGAVVTVGSASTVRGSWGNIETSLINNGLISAEGSGRILINGPSLVNNATMQALPGGTLDLFSGTTRAWSNNGTILVNGGTLNIGGVVTPAGLGNLTRTGGTVNITGTLDNTGNAFTLNSTTGSWNMTGGGTIRGGSLGFADGAQLNILNGTLAGVTYNGDISLATGQLLTLRDGLTLNGSLRMSPGWQMLSGNSQTINSGQFIFDSSNSTQCRIDDTSTASPTTLTFGPNSSLTVSNGSSLIIATADQVHQEPVLVTGAGTRLQLWGSNQGVMEVNNGGLLVLGDSFTYNGAAPNGRGWSNHGLVRVNNGTLKLDGTFSGADVGNIERAGGTILLAGKIVNTGQTLSLGTSSGGAWTVDTASITGGTLAVAPGGEPAFVPRDSSNPYRGLTLDTVTLTGSLPIPSSGVIVNGGLFLNNGTLTFTGDRTEFNFYRRGGNPPPVPEQMVLGGTGTVRCSPATGTTGMSFDSQVALTIEPGVTLAGAFTFSNSYTQIVANNGTILSDVPGRTSLVFGAVTNTGTMQVESGSTLTIWGPTFDNSGILRVNGGTLNLGSRNPTSTTGVRLLPGTQIVRNGGAINLTGILDLNGQTLVLDSGTGIINSATGVIKGGTLDVQPGGGLSQNPIPNYDAGLTLDSMRVTGLSLDARNVNGLSGTNPGVTIYHSLDGNATITAGNHPVRFLYSANETVSFNGTLLLDTALGTTGTPSISHLRMDTGPGTLILGTNGVVRGGGYQIAAAPNDLGYTFYNDGLISANNPGKRLLVFPRTFINRGIAEARDGGILSIQEAVAPTARAGWQNQGVLRVYPGSTLILGGQMNTGQLGDIQNLGGSVAFRGFIENSDRTWSLDTRGGEWALGGSLKGGILETPYGPLVVNGGGGVAVLDGCTVNGEINVVANGSIYVKNNPVINGLLRLSGANATLQGYDVDRLDVANILFDGASGGARRVISATSPNISPELTLGTGVNVHGGNGMVYTDAFVSIVNYGSITADVAGQDIQIITPRFSNQGTVQGINGGQIVFRTTPGLSPPGDLDPFINDGLLVASSIGGLPGGFDLRCPVLLGSTSILDIELSPGAWSQSAALSAATLFLDGTLVVTLGDGYSPVAGSQFQLLAADTITGGFGRVSLPDLPGGLWWETGGLEHTGLISVVPSPGAALWLAGLGLVAGRRRRS